MKAQKLTDNFFVPLNNLYLDEALKTLKANEFKTYMAVTYAVKKIGPNTKEYYSLKKELFTTIGEMANISYQTFLKHLKTFESIGLIGFSNSITLDIGYDIAESKSYGFTSIDIQDLKLLLTSLDQNEFKLYIALYRVLKGFNQTTARYTYAQLKTWSGIKNKAVFISARNSLVKKGLISALMDVGSGRFSFTLKELDLDSSLLDQKIDANSLVSEKKRGADTEKKLRYTDLKPLKRGADTDLKPLINRSSTFSNKSNKKSYLSSKQQYREKAQKFEIENQKKIFLFLSENLKTKDLNDSEKLNLIDALILEVQESGGVNGSKITSTLTYYLSQEHHQFGRTVDKIIDRYFAKIDQQKRDEEGRRRFYQVLKDCFPETAKGLEDFKSNDISKHKLDKIIRQSPGMGYYTEEFLTADETIKNSKYDKNAAQDSINYLDALIKNEVKNREISLDERLDLIERFLPEANLKFPIENEYIVQKAKLNYEQFCQKFNEL